MQRDLETLLLVCGNLVWGSLWVSPLLSWSLPVKASAGGANPHRPRKVKALDSYLFWASGLAYYVLTNIFFLKKKSVFVLCNKRVTFHYLLKTLLSALVFISCHMDLYLRFFFSYQLWFFSSNKLLDLYSSFLTLTSCQNMHVFFKFTVYPKVLILSSKKCILRFLS